MRLRHTAMLIVVWVTFPHATLHGSDTGWSRVVVRIYDTTEAPDAGRRAALDEARSILAAASVNVLWVECPSRAERHEPHERRETEHEGFEARGEGQPCDRPLGRGELVVRIQWSSEGEDSSRPLPLGDAYIDSRVGAGVLATVYFDRVVRVAGQTGTDWCALLGRTVAHELGHLLLASSAHSASGLMRAVWSHGELQARRRSDWALAEADAEAIRNRALPPRQVE